MQEINKKIANVLINVGTATASNMLFAAGMKEDFSNPFINTAQSLMMFSGDIDWMNGDLKSQLALPLLNTAALAIDDFLIDKGFTSKHHITDITTALAVGNNMAKTYNGFGNLLGKWKVLNEPFLTIPFAAGLYGLKKLMNGDDVVSTMRSGGIKLMKHIEEVNKIKEGAISIDKATLVHSIISSISSPKMLELIPEEYKMLQGYVNIFKDIGKAIFNEIYAIQVVDDIKNITSNRYKSIIQTPEYLLRIASSEKHNKVFKNFQKISDESLRGISDLTNACGSLSSSVSSFSSNPIAFFGTSVLNSFWGIS